MDFSTKHKNDSLILIIFFLSMFGKKIILKEFMLYKGFRYGISMSYIKQTIQAIH